MVVYSTDGYSIIYNVVDKLKAAARKSGLFLVVDSDLAFNTPTVRVEVNRSKANELGVTMENIGNTLALMVGGNYVNRFDLQGRSYEVIPQVPRVDRLTPDSLVNYYVQTASGTEVPLSTLVNVTTATDPNALTQYNQLNSATFQAVPWPGVTIGQAVGFLEQQAASFSRRISPTPISGIRANMWRKATSSFTRSSSPRSLSIWCWRRSSRACSIRS